MAKLKIVLEDVGLNEIKVTVEGQETVEEDGDETVAEALAWLMLQVLDNVDVGLQQERLH